GHVQAMTALVTPERQAHLRAERTVAFALIKALSRESLLCCDNCRVVRVRLIAVAVRIVVRFGLVNTGIVVILRLIGIAVLIVMHLPLIIAGIVVARLRIGRIRVVVVVVRVIVARVWRAVAVVVRIVSAIPPPRIKTDIEYHPRSIDEAAPMAIPPMVAMPVPVAMPIPRLLPEDVLLPVTAKTSVSIPVSVSIAELIHGISLVPHACGGRA